MSKLPAFDHAEWMKGMMVEIRSQKGPSKGNVIGSFWVKADKPVKVERTIKPAIGALACNEDNQGRSLVDHRAMVEYYGDMYDAGLDPLTGQPISEIESYEYYAERENGDLAPLKRPKAVNEMRGVEQPREDEPWREDRKSGNHDEAGLKLLAKAFRAMHDMD